MSSARDLRRKALRAFVMITVKPGTSEDIVRSRRIKGVRINSDAFYFGDLSFDKLVKKRYISNEVCCGGCSVHYEVGPARFP